MNHIGDWLPILIFIGAGLYKLFQFLSRKKQDNPSSERSPSPTRSSSEDEEITSEWEELLEALGKSNPDSQEQRPKAPLPPPPPLVQTITPPPIPEAKPQPAPQAPPAHKHTTVSESLEEIDHLQYEKINASIHPSFEKLSELKHLQHPNLRPRSHKPKAISSRTRHSRILNKIRNRGNLRDAILINEILQPPLALKDY